MLTLRGKRALITGATSGLGLPLARRLANAGVEVILHGRSSEKIAAALSRLSVDVPAARMAAFAADLSTRAGVRSLVAQLRAAHATIDLVVNNAGAAFARFQVTEEGVERSVAINHQAPFLLNQLLLPTLAPKAVVVNISSASAGFVTLDTDHVDVLGTDMEREYTQLGAYGTSKLLNLLVTKSFAKRVGPDGPTIILVDPGGIKTDLAEKAGDAAFLALTMQHWGDCVTADEAAADLLRAVMRPAIEPGAIYHKGEEQSGPPLANDVRTADNLYEATCAAFKP